MRLQQVRRGLFRTMAAVYLLAIAAALVVVWTGPNREWFIETGRADITLSVALSSLARWVATALLGGLALLGLLALVTDSAATRREQALLALSARMANPASEATEGQRMVPAGRAASGPPVVPPFSRPAQGVGRFDAVVVGDKGTQRLEGSVTDAPSPEHAPDSNRELAIAGMVQPADEVTHQVRRPGH